MTTVGTLANTVRDSGTMIARGLLADLRRTRVRRAGPRVARTVFDPTAPENIVNPYPQLAQLREQPVAVNERLNVWMLARHADVLAAARAHDALSSADGILLRSMPLPGVVSSDEPDHTRLRRITAPSFTPGAVRGLEAILGELVEPSVAALMRGEPIDAVDALTVPLPVSAIALILGVESSRRGEFLKYSEDFRSVFAVSSLAEVARSTGRALPGMLAMRALIIDELDRRIASPTDDVFGRVRQALDEGDMSMLEALTATLILLVAGSETTTNLLGILLIQLATNPELFDRLREDRDLIPAATEEALRWGSPVQWVARTALRAYQVGEHTIPARSRVVLFYAGANRDPAQFDRPDEFDIDRGSAGHVTFGHGAHFCMGAHLARLEVRVALNKILDQARGLRLAGPVVWTTTPSLSGPTSVPIRVVR
ncbi:cytochrome [Mycobacterium sp. E802]|uniref:cytochrome P450 n=1 Tax=Mycobacterium sp. E802 TaxID=1834152 RepID=UPI0007FEA67B|nr:cytochrome P450 [Mycobacterium sp. E802]OBG86346.1 cytochrome [Mycobacterium sp. E802]